jgi:hypothetical protein
MQSCGFGEVDRSTKRHALANIMSNIQERPFVTTAFDGGITHHPKVLVMIDFSPQLSEVCPATERANYKAWSQE